MNGRVLLVYRYHEWVTGRWLESGLRGAGYEVKSVGPTIGDQAQDIGTSGARLNIAQLYADLVRKEWRADILIHVDSGPLFLDGVETLPIPTIYYGIDVDNSPAYSRNIAKLYDLTCVSQLPDFRYFDPWTDVVWVPLAYSRVSHQNNGEDHVPRSAGFEYDLVIVGSPYEHRVRLADNLRRHGLTVYLGPCPPEEQGQLYRSAVAGLNLSRRGEINARVFEILGFGAPLISDWNPEYGLQRLFDIGTECLGFRSLPELREHVDWLKSDPIRRRELAHRGRQAVLTGHTWRLRGSEMVRLARERQGTRKVSSKLPARHRLIKAKFYQSRLAPWVERRPRLSERWRDHWLSEVVH